jgi:hypothetical protein
VSRPAQSRKGRTLLAIVLLVLASFGALSGAAFWAGVNLDAKAKSLGDHLENASRVGLVTRLDDLVVPAQDPKQDALPDLMRAYEIWQGMSHDDQDRLNALASNIVAGRARRTDYVRFARATAGATDMMDALRLASAKDECSVQQAEAWNSPEHRQFAQFVRKGVRMIAAEAVSAGLAGNLVRAEALLVGATRLTHHLGAQSSVGPLLRQTAAELEVQRALIRIVNANRDLPLATAQLIRRQQDRLGPMPSIARGLSGELALVLAALDDEEHTGLDRVPGGPFFRDIAKAGVTEIWVRHFRKLPNDPTDLNGAERVLIGMGREGEDTAFYGQYVLGYESVVPRLRDVLTRRRLALAAARVLELRAADVDLSDPSVIGNLGIDPHSGQQLRVQTNERSLILYSVGRDGVDNGGTPPDGDNPFSDILFVLPHTYPARPR